MVSFVDQSVIFIKNHLDDILLMSLGMLIFAIIKTNISMNSKKENIENDDVENDNVVNTGKRVKKEIIIENMDVKQKKKEKEHNDIVNGVTANFCKTMYGNSHLIEKKCEIQTKGACKARTCCVLTKINGEDDLKCVAGSKLGPTYHSDDNGKDINFDYYYYQNKCYGTNCPKQ